VKMDSYREQCLAYLNNLTVSSIHSVQKIIQLPSTATLIHGFETLLDNNILSAPVYIEGSGEYVGFLDIRDIVSFVVFVYDQQIVSNDSRLADLIRYGVGQFHTLTTDGVTLTYLARRNIFRPVKLTDSLMKVIKILGSGLHRVPVLDDEGKLVNIISQSTIIALMAQLNFQDNVPIIEIPSLGTIPVVTVNCEESVISTYRKIDSHKLSGVAIVDNDGRMVGVTTGKDLKYFIRNPHLATLEMKIFDNIKQIRNNDIEIRTTSISVFERDTLKRTIQLIAATKVHRVFVMNNDNEYKPLRVISISDVLKFFSQ